MLTRLLFLLMTIHDIDIDTRYMLAVDHIQRHGNDVHQSSTN